MTSNIPSSMLKNPVFHKSPKAFIDPKNPQVMSDTYKNAIQSLRESNATLKRWIGLIKSETNTIIGYGLTFEGISELMQLKKMKSRITQNPAKLIEEMLTMEAKSSFACTIDSNLFGEDGNKIHYHAISIFIRKLPNLELQIFFNDSKGRPPEIDFLQKALISVSYSIYGSQVVRQNNDLSCQTFALIDCEAFEKDPDLIDKILSVNEKNLTKNEKGFFEIKKLPKEMNTLLRSVLPLTIDHQMTLVKHHVRSPKAQPTNSPKKETFQK